MHESGRPQAASFSSSRSQISMRADVSSSIISAVWDGPGVNRSRSVPRSTERLRFTPGPCHSAEMMDALTAALVEIWDRPELLDVRAA